MQSNDAHPRPSPPKNNHPPMRPTYPSSGERESSAVFIRRAVQEKTICHFRKTADPRVGLYGCTKAHPRPSLSPCSMGRRGRRKGQHLECGGCPHPMHAILHGHTTLRHPPAHAGAPITPSSLPPPARPSARRSTIPAAGRCAGRVAGTFFPLRENGFGDDLYLFTLFVGRRQR